MRFRPTAKDRPVDWVDLAALIITGTASLPGAACTSRPDLFDPESTDEYVIAEALTLCHKSCPVLKQCREWDAAQPKSRQLYGVTAGRYRPQPRTRKASA